MQGRVCRVTGLIKCDPIREELKWLQIDLGRQTIEVIDAELDTSTDPFRYRRPRRTWGVFGLQSTFKGQEFEVLCKNIAAAKI